MTTIELNARDEFTRTRLAAFTLRYAWDKVVRLWREVRNPKLRMFIYEIVYSLCRALGRPPARLSWLAIGHVDTCFGRFDTRPGTIDAACVSPAFERPDRDFTLSLIRDRLASGRRVHFIDVGADIGTYAVSVGTGFAEHDDLTITAYEPACSSRELLATNLELNDLAGHVTVRPLALSDRSGTAELTFSTTEPGSSGLNPSHVHGDVRETVALSTLDEECGGFPSSHETVLVKIDVEGHETEVVRGAEHYFATVDEVILLVEDFVDRRIIDYLGSSPAWSRMAKHTPYNSFWVKR